MTLVHRFSLCAVFAAGWTCCGSTNNGDLHACSPGNICSNGVNCVAPPTSSTTTSTTTSSTTGNGGSVAGGVIGGLAGFGVLGCIIYYGCMKHEPVAVTAQ